LKEGKNEWCFFPFFLKIKDIVRILRHRNRGLITKLRELWQKQTDMRHFVISQLLEKISIIAFCLCAAASLSFVHLHCPGSAHWQRMLQLMQEMFEAYHAILQFFLHLSNFNPSGGSL